jgi:hypothetical protein
MYNSLNLAWGAIQLFQAKFMHLVSPTINKCIPVQGVAGLVMAYAIRQESPFTTRLAKKKKEKEIQALQAKQDAAALAAAFPARVRPDRKEQPKLN